MNYDFFLILSEWRSVVYTVVKLFLILINAMINNFYSIVITNNDKKHMQTILLDDAVGVNY